LFSVHQIDGVSFSIPFNSLSFKVYYRGSTVRLETTFGVFIEYDGIYTARVVVPKVQYAGLLHGLCGNNDGIALNDWTLANGTIVDGRANAVNIFGDSFVIANDPEVDPA
jgi:von Willebrand factor type D domain